MQVVKYQLKVR